ncbi:uncharacterized protein J7T54_005174 [Emericellopsis cladophorae]|uniref:Uncharacterized protein n=1 Tax=Emericellopsis cladophorae TaxID=2686198 RepID=A0A9P9Y1P3_9HYPO|nr:uncharacterized protein J7T54_005174 [Emericellopsis cladophorae]KAI6781963.1 hypothetical protein J7T54_005174 [Emericellopsis cladophorae]
MSVHARNDVFDTNPASGARSLTQGGSNWLWAVTAVFAISSLVLLVLGLRPRHGERIFHYLFTIALLVGAITYFAMASDLGWSVVRQHLRVSEAATYQVFFAKYIFWVVAFPAIVIALGLASGVSWATIVYNIFLTWIWIISYLVGAYTRTRYKWGFFTSGTVAYLLLAYQTLWSGWSASRRFPHQRDYTLLAGYANLFWLIYPIAWAVTDGGNVIGVTQMAIFFGILDVLLVCGLAFAFIFLSKGWDHHLMHLHFTRDGRVPHAREFHEKHPIGERGVGAGAGTGTGATAGAGDGVGTTAGYTQPV